MAIVTEEVPFVPTEDLQYRELKTGVLLQLTDDPVEQDAIAGSSLFVVSNKFGYFVAGSSNCLVFDKLSVLRKAFEEGTGGDDHNKFESRAKIEIPNNALRIIRLSADELTVVVSLAGGIIQLYKVVDLLAQSKNARPCISFKFRQEILDIRPNPSPDKNGLAAVLLADRTIELINTDGAPTVVLKAKKYTAMAWSAKGKQIMCGTDTGVLQQIDPEGVVKKEHQPNPENEGKMVVGINWIETAVFIAVYCVPPADDNDTPEYDVCVISKEVPSSPKYQTFGDICFAMPQEGAGSVYFMTPSIKSWGGEFKELITVASSPSMDVVGIGRGSDGDWKKWDLDDTKRATVPGFDSICLGLGLDLTSTAALEPLEEDGPAVQPCPIIYIYTHLGALAAFHILNLQAAKTGAGCPAMVKPADLPESAPKPKASPSATKATVAAPIAATKATAAIPTAAAPTASAGAFGSISKTPVSPFATTAATGSPLSKSTIATPPLQQLKPAGLQKMNFGAPSPLSNPPTTSFAPNPAVTPNPSFQQAKPAASTTTSVRPSPSLQQNKAPAPKQPGIMQKLLQEDKPLKIIRKKSQSEESSAPAPKVSAAMDALSRQLENTYLAMTEELRTLSSHVKETEELIKARELVFEELDQFMRVTTKRIKAASDAKALAESVYKDFVQLRADLIKATTKKDEIGRLLRARQDPNLHDMLQYNELNPAQLSQQARMKASFEVVDKRLVELEDYVETLSLKATRLRQGHDFEGPTLDSIRRAIWNISHTLLQRQDDLDQLSRALDDFSISGSLNPTRDRSKKVSVKESATPNPRASLRGSVALSSMVDQRPITKIKNEMAQALKRVLTRDARVKPIFTSLSQNGPGGTLSMIPRTQAPEFIPAPEPRRAEAKKRLSAVISPPSEQQAVTTPAADATLPAFPSPGFASPGFASPGFASPGFAATSQSFQSPTTAMDAPKAFTGFQVPTPFKAPQNTPPAFGFAETLSQQRYEEKDYEEAFKDGNAQDEQEHYEGEEEEEEEEEEEDEEVEEEEGEEEEEQARSNERYTHYVHDGQEYELEEGSEPETWGSETDQRDYDRDDDQEEEEQEEASKEQEKDEQRQEEAKSVQVQQSIQLPSKAETNPETEKKAWSAPGFQFPAVASPTSGTRTSSDAGYSFFTTNTKQPKDTTQAAKAQPAFGTVSGNNTFGSQTAFSFGKALEATPTSSVATTPKEAVSSNGQSQPSIPFAKVETPVKAPVVTTTSTLREQPVADSDDEQNNEGEEKEEEEDAYSEAEIDKKAYRGDVASEREQDQGKGEEDEADEVGGVLGDVDERQNESDEGEQADASDAGDDSDKESALTAIQVAQEKPTSSTFDSQARSSVTSTGSFSIVNSANALEESDLDFGKVGLGSSISTSQKSDETTSKATPLFGGSSTCGSAPAFGSGPAFGSAASSKSGGKGLDMPFVKLPRAPKGTRDSLDSNTDDDDDENAVVSDSDSSPVIKNREVKLSTSADFGKPSTDNKSSEGGLESFSLSLGGDPTASTGAKSSPWGTSSTSSWESISKSSAPVSGWGMTSTLGSALPTSTTTPAVTSSATPALSAWGSGGSGFGLSSQLGSTSTTASGFGQTSKLGSDTSVFGQTSTLSPGFGQSSQIGGGTSTFGQASTLGSGFGQTSPLGAATSVAPAFGQTSSLGSTGTSAAPAFGQTSSLGGTTTATPVFGQASQLTGSGFGQTSQFGTGAAFGQTSQLGSGTAFGQTSAVGAGSGFGSGSTFGQSSTLGSGVAFGQTSFGQPSQLGGGFAKVQPTSFATQSNFGSFAGSGTNAFAALASSGTNVLDQQASQGSGFGDSSSNNTFGSGGNTGSIFGTGGGFGNSGGGASVFGSGSGFESGGGFGGASNSGSGFSSFGTGGGFGSASGFGAGQGDGGFGAAGNQQGFGGQGTTPAFGTSSNINTNKSSFQGFR